MQYFEWNGQQATWRNHGETVVLEPWGPDSLRVRAVLMGEVARRAGSQEVEACRGAAVELFAACTPERRFPELQLILSDVCGEGHSAAAVYSSVYFALRILGLARAAGDPSQGF